MGRQLQCVGNPASYKLLQQKINVYCPPLLGLGYTTATAFSPIDYRLANLAFQQMINVLQNCGKVN